ncbi:MAG: hypothetical protein FWC26_10940 [Fibromonadales bacterium]|nr:hypothetical protein [Fibromonadales bacterium]
MERQEILANVSNLTAEQLFEEIKQGNITLDELRSNGLDPNVRRRISELQKQNDLRDDEAWECARYGNEATLRDYITHYPAGKHVQEAKDKINALVAERNRAGSIRQKVLNDLRQNPNSYSSSEIIDYLKNTITTEDLHDCNVPDHIIERMHNITALNLNLGLPPDAIPDGYTEVYFWGIPGSGKTCALAALLSSAYKAGYLNIANSPGYDYMTRLKNIFIKDAAILPSPSPVEVTQYLPFTLKKATENNSRSVSLIELSGEIFQCFYYLNASLPLPSEQHEKTFNTLKSFLGSKNRKIHFFFIDYDKGNREDASGYTQSDYLDAAASYFTNSRDKVFGTLTDAIYVVLTKSDLMLCSKEERVAKAKEHLENESFSAFINVLKKNCKDHRINAGRLMLEPFSLGKVYFKQICDFDNSTAMRIIDILLERIPQSKKSILDVFNK